MVSFGKLFSTHSGAGGPECAGKALGYELIGGIEIAQYPVDLYKANFGDHVRHESILDTAIAELPKSTNSDPITLWSSPQCKYVSGSNRNGGETPDDIAQAKKVCAILIQMRPQNFALENVRRYLNTRSFRHITETLDSLGYQYESGVYNAADFGGAQDRHRLVLRATFGELKDLELTHSQWGDQRRQLWNGWHSAISDLLPTLKPAKVTERQLLALEASAGVNNLFPCIMERVGYGARHPIIRRAWEPCWTIRSSCGCDGKGGHRSPITWVVSKDEAYHLDYRCLARLQGFPEEYRWGESDGRNNYAIGNAVHVKVAKAVLSSFV